MRTDDNPGSESRSEDSQRRTNDRLEREAISRQRNCGRMIIRVAKAEVRTAKGERTTGLSGKQFQDSEIADGWSETNPVSECEVGNNGVKPTTAASEKQFQDEIP